MKPTVLKAVDYPSKLEPIKITLKIKNKAKKELVGIDVFIDWEGDPNELGRRLEKISGDDLKLVMITNRGTKVYPDGIPETFCVDHWRCRFQSRVNGNRVQYEDLISLQSRLVDSGLPAVKTEGLYTFDGKPGYSLGQGQ